MSGKNKKTEVMSFKNVNDLLKTAREEDVCGIDYNFADIRGIMQRSTQDIDAVDEDTVGNGIMFDGSSIAGWKAINESDMMLKPDLSKVLRDPFSSQPNYKFFCDVYEPSTNQPYNRCPRSISKKAQDYLKNCGIADTAYFGPEPEFFVFDDVRYKVSMNHVSYQIDSEEGPYNTDTEFVGGNMGHRPGVKGGYFPEAPVDSLSDLRGQMLSILKQMGVPVEKHHHEVAPSQCELGIKYATLTDSADNVMLYKHVVHNVAHGYGKTATFMPKPIVGDNGSGMHVHQSLWKGGKPLFAGNEYAGLSKECLYYIGGIIKHARSLNAFTNPTTNSYKRLVPGYEAPVLLAYSARNRSASCRIPYSTSPNGKRVEVRFPDPTANPYLAFSAMLMAGLDGIKNKIHPGDAMDENLYELPKDVLKKVPHVCSSLRQSLDALASDHDYLTQGDVFTADMIEAYIDLKMVEVERFETSTHPVEYEMYYSA